MLVCYRCDALLKTPIERVAGTCTECIESVKRWEASKMVYREMPLISVVDRLGLWTEVGEVLDEETREV